MVDVEVEYQVDGSWLVRKRFEDVAYDGANLWQVGQLEHVDFLFKRFPRSASLVERYKDQECSPIGKMALTGLGILMTFYIIPVILDFVFDVPFQPFVRFLVFAIPLFWGLLAISDLHTSMSNKKVTIRYLAGDSEMTGLEGEERKVQTTLYAEEETTEAEEEEGL